MPKFPKRLLFALFVVVMFIAVAFLYESKMLKTRHAPIATFSECSAAGYPVLLSYPSQCTTPDGKIFMDAYMTDGLKAAPPKSYDQIPTR